MIYGLYNSAAGMLTNEYRQSVLANNLANAETVGFKPDIASFAERLRAGEDGVRNGPSDPSVGGLSGGMWLGRTTTDYSPGAFTPTEQPLDVAIEGPGFLVVAKDGKELYTRDGRMVIDAAGQLRAAEDGALVLAQGGAPIRLNPRGGRPFINEDGQISQDNVPHGRLALVDFDDYDALRKAGGSRFDSGGQPAQLSGALVRSGVVEASGVQPVQELVSMLEASRAYQMNAQMLTLQDQTVSRLISVVST